MQDFLNVKEEYLYAIVTNGLELRLLRDSSMMTRLSYVSFDLIQMLEEDLFSDFQLMYRLLHASRMPRDSRDPASSIIEKYHDESLLSGSRIREKLSEAVEQSIFAMGNAFLQDPANEALRQWAEQNSDAAALYYEYLLKLIYRILFLLVIEERDLVYPASYRMDELLRGKRGIYYQYYALQRLRRLSEKKRYASKRYADLWQQVLATFRLFAAGKHGQPLGIAPLAGDLFGTRAIGVLNHCQLNNKVLLDCIRQLNQFEDDRGQWIRVNYTSLDVEEFGSVYEGLLEFEPVINPVQRTFSFAQGTGRSSSGSHYTPDELVQPLIKHSLEHLIRDIVSPSGDDQDKDVKIQKLLQLTVCDVACGSGHILLAAARRIGLAVARLRSGEQQPNPEAVRQGVRDAIRHCIYGVDKNPLAVELCKVAMWLEAHVPGEPLNFLDHKIKNGDAIVGGAHLDELYDGIATEAFKPHHDGEKENCRLLKASNKKQRQAREAGQLRTHNVEEIVENKLSKYKEKFATFRSMPEHAGAHRIRDRSQKKSLSKAQLWYSLVVGKNPGRPAGGPVFRG